MSQPLKQGDMDGLCGIYALVNAVSHLWPEDMDQRRQDGLFADLMTAVNRKLPEAVTDGTTTTDLALLAEVATGFVARNLPGRLKVSQPWTRAKAPATAADWLRMVAGRVGLGQGSVAILGLFKPAHWTVLTAVRDDAAHVADSQDFNDPIPLAAIGLQRGGSEEVILHRRAAFLLTRTE